jgi:hemerythrin-like domain-containing protein
MADALQLLREDHKRVKDLFNQFEGADDTRLKGEIVKRTLMELEIHAEIEEKIFYPAVRKEADADEDQMDEAEEEHHVVKLLIAELRRMKPGAQRFDAKFTVLAENVKHHIDEEESEMLPKAAELGMARMNELGAEMEQRKSKLQSTKRRPSPSNDGARKRAVARSAKPAARTRTSTNARSRTAKRAK